MIFTLVFAAVQPGCAGRPVAPQPWYDFDTVYMNEGVGGQAPWRRPDKRAAARATAERERAWARAEKAERPSAVASARPKAQKAPPAKVAAAPKKPAAKKPAATPKKPAAGVAAKPKPVPARIGGKKPAAPPKPVPVLGDGSVSGELLAAALRLHGITDDFASRPFLLHLLTVAAVDLDVSAPPSRFVAATWEALERRGLTFDRSRTPEPGDLAFFDHLVDLDGDGRADDPLTGVAVVERVRSNGVILCLGEVHGKVRRFAMDPRRPHVRRDERTGKAVNTPLRPRRLAEGPDAPYLAGALLAGYARP